MITIQGFAKLCGCTTQTLRYYDRTGILKPAKVDEWTGYRYYEEEQALQFVKIKNLQQADFSIEEIRDLLPGDDDLLAAALDRKIREQREKLERMEKIQRSYLREKMDIQNVITLLGRFMEGQIKNPGLWKEFGLEGEKDAEIRARAEDTLVSWLADLRDANAKDGLGLDIALNYYGSESFTRMFHDKVGDQRIFVENGVPCAVFTSGITMNTNKPSDTAKTLNYDIFKKRIFLIFHWLTKMM